MLSVSRCHSVIQMFHVPTLCDIRWSPSQAAATGGQGVDPPAHETRGAGDVYPANYQCCHRGHDLYSSWSAFYGANVFIWLPMSRVSFFNVNDGAAQGMLIEA